MSKAIQLNIAVIGLKSSGKTALGNLYVNGFTQKKDSQPCTIKETKLLDNDVRINVLDLEFEDLTAESLKSVQGIIVVFDIDKPELIDELKKLCNENKNLVGRNVVLAVAANNGHLRSSNYSGPLVPVEQYKQIESDYHCQVFEVSTETGENVDNIFNYVGENILHQEHLDKSNVKDIRDCIIE